MKRKRKWIILALLLLPIVIAVGILTVEAFDGVRGRRIGLVRVDDVILSSEKCVKQLRSYGDDPSIAGVIIRINSPGGAVAPSQEIHREVLRFREAGKPVVASMANVGASGAYYIASACDRIFANPGTITGSIGVLMTMSRVHRLFDKIGVDVEIMKAGKLKDVGSPHREMTAQERRFLQDVLDDIHDQFIDDVCAARSVVCDSLEVLAEGQIFTGRQALVRQLVDTLGGYEDAVKYVKQAAGIPDKAKVYEKKRRTPLLWELLASRLGGLSGTMGRVLYPDGIYYLYDGD